MDTTTEENSLKVFMLPWLAHGHISPYLELAKRLTKRNISVYLCSTPINLQSIAGKLKNYSATIQPVELHLPSSPELPPHLHTTNGLPPHLMKTLGDAFQRSHPNLSDILKKLNPDIVIHEAMHPWVGELASSLGIPAIDFLTVGATTISFFMHMMRNSGSEYPTPGIYLHDFEKIKILAQAGSAADDSKNRHHSNESPKTSCNLRLIKSFRELEGEAIDYFSAASNKKIFPVGPLAEETVNKSKNDNTEIIKWLNKKDKTSSVFVSFGSEYYLSNDEMEEIAYGLELSEVNFIWVVRFPKEEGKETNMVLEDKLPKGYLERVGDRGLVLEGWAPQVEILSHESVGGFVSHCGWGSIMESVKLGVPIIALPMHLDQPLNARQMVHVGVAVEAVRDKMGKIQREEVAKAIRQVVADESGKNVRGKVKEMSETLRLRGDIEIDELAPELFHICGKNRREEIAKMIRQVAVDESGKEVSRKVRELSEKIML